jgi:hypothetical protein
MNTFPDNEFRASRVETLSFPSLEQYVKEHQHLVGKAALDDGGWTLAERKTEDLLRRIKDVGSPLENYVMGRVFYGIKTGLNKAFVIDENTKKRLIEENSKSEEFIKPFLLGRDIKRYQTLKIEKFLILIPNGWTDAKTKDAKNKWRWFEENYPAIAKHLVSFEKEADARADKGAYWWELRPCDYYEQFEKPKIIYPEICQKPEFTLDERHYYANNKCFIIPRSDKYLLGILNSKLTYFLFETNLPKLQQGFFMPAYVVLKNFPIYVPDFDDPADVARHDRMVALVTQMLDLNKRLGGTTLEHEKTVIQRQIEVMDREIDNLVYELYGLTEEEIKIVEEATKEK